MPLGHLLSGTKEARFIERRMKLGGDLIDIETWVFSAHGVEEHPRLHRRQFVGIDYRGHGAFAGRTQGNDAA